MSLHKAADTLGLGQAKLHVKYEDDAPKTFKKKPTRTIQCSKSNLIRRILDIEYAFKCTVIRVQWRGKLVPVGKLTQ